MNHAILCKTIKELRLPVAIVLAGLLTAIGLSAGVESAQAQAGTIEVVVSPSTITADGVSTATITATVSGITPTSGVSLSSYLSPTTLGNVTPFSPTDEAGQAFSTWKAGTVAGSGQLIVVGNNMTGTANVTLTAGQLATITVTPNPVTVTAGLTRTFTAAGFDPYSNSVPISPTWTTNGGDINASGLFTAQSSVAAGRLVTATVDSISGTATVNIVHAALASITVSPNPVTVTAGLTQTFTAVGLDPYSNSVPISPTWTTNGGGINASGLFTAQTSVAVGRLVTATVGLISGTATVNIDPAPLASITVAPNPVTVTAGLTRTFTAAGFDPYSNSVPISPIWTTNGGNINASGLFTAQTSVATGRLVTATQNTISGAAVVNISAGPVTTITVQVNPATLIANSPATATITATVVDRYNNPVPGVPLTGTVPVTLGIVSGLGTTNAGGRAFGAWAAGAVVGNGSLSVSSGSITGVTAITLTVGAPYTITLQATPDSLVVGNSSSLKATVIDRFSNPVANGTLVTFTSNIGNVSPPSDTTLNGIAASSINSTQAGTAYITATSGSAQGTAAAIFSPDVPFSMTLQARPVTQTVHLSSVLTATVYDHFSNPVANNTIVTFTQDLPGSIRSPVTTTNGVATSQVTVTIPGIAHITATSGSAWQATVVTFTPGAATTVTVQVNPPNLIANSNTTATITATVVDRDYNPILGVALTGTLPITLGTLSGLGATNANGQAFGVWRAGTTRGSGLLRVGNGAVTGTATIALLLSSPQTVTIQIISPTLLANSDMTTSVTVIVSDTFDNPIPEAALNFSLLPSALGNVTTSVKTDASGRAYNVWTAGGFIGSGQMIADAGSATGVTAITLTADAPNALLLQANPTSTMAGVGSTLSAIVSDRFDNPVTNGTPVTFTSSVGTIPSPATTVNGVASSHLNWTGVGAAYITATSGSVSSSAHVDFVPNVPATVILQANPMSPVVGTSSLLTATVRDLYSNSVADGTLVTFTASLGSVTSPATTTNGVATSSISSTRSGAAHITATSGSAQNSVTVVFVAGALATATIELSTNTLVANSGATAAITATIMDTYNNFVPGRTVTGSILPTTLGNASFPERTNANGQAFGTWKAGTVPGTGVLVVENASVPITLTPTTVFMPLVMRNFPPTPAGQWVRINQGAASTFQITVSLEVSATVQLDYIEWMRFSNDNIHWGNWMSFAPTATWQLGSNNGLVMAYAQFRGHGGGISPAISGSILLFKNGDFSRPDLESWSRDPGNALSVSASTEPNSPTNPAGLLGNPAYISCDPGANVPVGYASIFQSFTMPSVPAGKQLVLRFNYHIFTLDRNMQLIDGYDRFDVLLGSNEVLSDMNQSRFQEPNCSATYDLGRIEAVVPVSASLDSVVNVIFRLSNLPDPAYNTYVYLDNVRLEFAGSDMRYDGERLPRPDQSSGYAGREPSASPR